MQRGTETSVSEHLHLEVVPGSTVAGPSHTVLTLLSHTVQYGNGSWPSWMLQSTCVREQRSGFGRTKGWLRE